MTSQTMRGSRVIIAVAVVLGIVTGTTGNARADAITKVQGMVTDQNGKPMAKVPI